MDTVFYMHRKSETLSYFTDYKLTSFFFFFFGFMHQKLWTKAGVNLYSEQGLCSEISVNPAITGQIAYGVDAGGGGANLEVGLFTKTTREPRWKNLEFGHFTWTTPEARGCLSP